MRMALTFELRFNERLSLSNDEHCARSISADVRFAGQFQDRDVEGTFRIFTSCSGAL